MPTCRCRPRPGRSRSCRPPGSRGWPRPTPVPSSTALSSIVSDRVRRSPGVTTCVAGADRRGVQRAVGVGVRALTMCGGHPHPAVGDGREDLRGLDRVDRDGLAEEHGVLRAPVPLVGRVQDARRLALELEAGPGAEAELGQVVVADLLAGISWPIITVPVFEDSARTPVVVSCRPACSWESLKVCPFAVVYSYGTIHCRSGSVDARLERRGHGDDLGGRAGLEDVGDGARATAVGGGRARVVGVDRARVGQREDLAGRDVHGDQRAGRPRPVRGDLPVDRLLGLPLQVAAAAWCARPAPGCAGVCSRAPPGISWPPAPRS